jgi:pSer/pThr/pTyr-binding forkhead associated (FHA) protein
VSRQHAVIRRVGAELRVEPLKNRNGVFVNGAPAEPNQLLSPGDVLVFGKAVVRVVRERRPETSRARHETLNPSDSLQDLTPTGNTRLSADFLEQILATTIARGRPPELVRTLREMMEHLSMDVEAGRARLDALSIERLSGIASLVTSWSEDPERLEWRERFLRRLGAVR